MAYNTRKGKQQSGDVQFEGDPTDTQIDFENDFVAIKTNAQQRFIVSGSAITSSVNIVPSVTLTNDLGSTDLEWSRLYVEEVIGDIEGAIRFDAVNDEGDAISKGQVVYIKGVSGQTPTVALAAADDANKMPAFGLAGSNAANGASVQVVTFGSLQNLNLSSLFPDETFAEGDPVFVQTGSGGVSGSLTAVRPLGAANLIQNMGMVVRNGVGGDNQIKVGGAGRTNATPNLDKGYLFVGDDTNCSTPDNTVFISSSASRVGINTTNPGAALDVSGSVYITGPDALVSGSKGLFNLNDGTLQVGTEEVGTGVAVKIRSDVDSGVPLLVKSPSHEVILACTGSGKVTVGGIHLDAKMNISGSDTDKLISATGETRSPAFYVSASGETFVSGNLILQNIDPVIHFSNSAGIGLGTIGYNSSDNILIQNETVNKHIVLKANDAGTLREGFRLDGAVPEVVVNQTSESLVDFRVESDNQTHMLYVEGAADKVGINTNEPTHTFSVNGATSISGSTAPTVLEVTGASNSKLILARSDMTDPAFYVSGSGDVFISGSLRTKQFSTTIHNFNNSGVAPYYIPFMSTVEAVSPTYLDHMIAPADGRLVKAFLRIDGTQSGSVTLDVHATDLWQESIAGSPSKERVTRVITHRNNTYMFPTSGSVHFSEGDIVGVRIDPYASSSNVNVTCVWEYDYRFM